MNEQRQGGDGISVVLYECRIANQIECLCEPYNVKIIVCGP